MKAWLYILVMALTTYLIRVLPLTLIRKPIRSVFLKSFLYYVPYVTLAVMTFPAITEATQSPSPGGRPWAWDWSAPGSAWGCCRWPSSAAGPSLPWKPSCSEQSAARGPPWRRFSACGSGVFR